MLWNQVRLKKNDATVISTQLDGRILKKTIKIVQKYHKYFLKIKRNLQEIPSK